MEEASWNTWKRNGFTTFAIGCIYAEPVYLIGTLIVFVSELGPDPQVLFWAAAAVAAGVVLLCWIAATFERDHRWIVLPLVAAAVPAGAFFLLINTIELLFH